MYCLLIASLFFIGALHAQPAQDKEVYQAQDFSNLKGMPGLHEDLINLHLTLYKGYVKHVNMLNTTLQELLQEGNESTYEYGALKRRFAWEFDGMRFHEYYFQNLGGQKPIDQKSMLYQKIINDFGSFNLWKKEFKAMGLIRGIGWVVLFYDAQVDRLFNVWVEEHDIGPLVTGKPILVMDVWEHAYITQYGLDRAKYIDAFYSNINWSVAAKRFDEAK